MKITRAIAAGVLAGIISLSAGCSWFKTTEDIDPNGRGTIPGAEARPEQLGPITGEGGEIMSPTGFTAGGGDQLAGLGDLIPIPNLNFPTIYFAYDQDRIGASEQMKLEKVADYLLQHKNIFLIVEGHCDERGSAEYNRALGERRALSVKQYMTNLGIADNRIKTISYGEERPAVMGTTPEIFSKNRRAELIPARSK